MAFALEKFEKQEPSNPSATGGEDRKRSGVGGKLEIQNRTAVVNCKVMFWWSGDATPRGRRNGTARGETWSEWSGKAAQQQKRRVRRVLRTRLLMPRMWNGRRFLPETSMRLSEGAVVWILDFI